MPEQPIIPKSTIAEGTDFAIEELRSEKVILEKQIAAPWKKRYIGSSWSVMYWREQLKY